MTQNQIVIEDKKIKQFLTNFNVLAELAKDNPDVQILKSYQGFVN